MAQVPIYNGPQLKTQALQPNYQNNVDVSSGTRALGQGLMQASENLDRIVMRDAQDEAFKIEQQIRSDWQQHRADLRKNYKADNADEYRVKADEWWKTAKDTYGKDASPLARSMAGKSIGQYMVQAEADTLGYVEGEKTKAREVNFRTLQEGIITEAGQAVTPANASVVAATTAAQIRKNAIAYAAAEGYGSDVGEKMAREQLDKFHSETALSLASKDAKAAKEYLAEFGKDIPQGLRTRIDDAVTKNYNDQEGKRISQSLAGKTYAEKQEALSAIEDADLRESASIHVDRDQTKLNAVKTEAVKSLRGEVKLAYEKTGRVPPTAMSALEDLDKDTAADLWHGIKADQKARAREAKGEEIKTDLSVYYALRQAAMDPETQTRFASTDLMKFRDTISTTDLKGLMTLQGSINKSDAKAMDQQRQLKQTLGMIKTTMLSAGLDLTPKEGSDKAVELNKFMGQLTLALDAAQARQPDKPLTQDQLQKEGMLLLQEAHEQGSGFFGFGVNKKRLYQVRSDPDAAGKNYVQTKYSDIPENIRSELEASVPKKTGMYGSSTNNEAVIERMYQIGRDQGRFK
jgi:hypothetical protein